MTATDWNNMMDEIFSVIAKYKGEAEGTWDVGDGTFYTITIEDTIEEE